MDSTKDDLLTWLTKSSYFARAKTFFLWEGVFYLPESAVKEPATFRARTCRAWLICRAISANWPQHGADALLTRAMVNSRAGQSTQSHVSPAARGPARHHR